MPVLNEEKLLPALLANIESHVDEIVIVDGGPDGPSTDNTGEIARSHEKVVYESGKFATFEGAWDESTHRNTAIARASHDVLLLISADMFFLGLENLAIATERASAKIFFCTTLEFWCDTNHLRQHENLGTPTWLPAGILEPIAIDRCFNPYWDDNGSLVLSDAVVEDRLVIPQLTKFHLGWIRPFRQQMNKHIRHVKQHRWDKQGEALLRGGQRSLEQWAIFHVLNYPKTPAVSYHGWFPEELELLKSMKPEDGSNEVLTEFEEQYGMSVFKMKKEL
jgi:glycosyltransferase involved in cell wall biosynthesis